MKAIAVTTWIITAIGVSIFAVQGSKYSRLQGDLFSAEFASQFSGDIEKVDSVNREIADVELNLMIIAGATALAASVAIYATIRLRRTTKQSLYDRYKKE